MAPDYALGGGYRRHLMLCAIKHKRTAQESSKRKLAPCSVVRGEECAENRAHSAGRARGGRNKKRSRPAALCAIKKMSRAMSGAALFVRIADRWR